MWLLRIPYRTSKIKAQYVVFFAKKFNTLKLLFQKQPSRGILKNRCSENIQQIYRRTPMPKCYFNKVAMERFVIIVNGFGTGTASERLRSTSGRLLLLFLIENYLEISMTYLYDGEDNKLNFQVLRFPWSKISSICR